MNEDLLQNIRTSQDAKKAGLPVFKVLSDGNQPIKAYKDENGVRRFSITASSDATDLAGDVFTSKSLQKLESTAKGMTMFLNHSYDVPKDVFGAVEVAELARKKVFNRALAAEVEQLCLTYHGIVTEINPDAVKTHDMMMEGVVTLGGSISVLIVEKFLAKDGRRMIDDVVNLECSIVGLPCNPTSWVESASKALKMSEEKEPPVTDDLKQASTIAPQNTQPETTEVISKETAMTEPNAPVPPVIAPTETAPAIKQIIQKGIFNDVLKENESSIYHLTDLLCSALWRLYCACYYDGTDVDVDAELNTLCDEFKAVAMERLLPRFKGTDSEDKSVGASLATIKSASGFAQFLTNDVTVTKTLSDIVEKAGRRNSTNDQEMIDDIHGLTVNLGAECKSVEPTDESKETAAPDADKAASQASEADTATVETLHKSVAEALEMANLNADALDAVIKQRDEALQLAELTVKKLEEFGAQPMQPR